MGNICNNVSNKKRKRKNEISVKMGQNVESKIIQILEYEEEEEEE